MCPVLYTSVSDPANSKWALLKQVFNCIIYIRISVSGRGINLPGDFLNQFFPFFLLNAAITSLCLAISSWSSTNEQASLGSIYLVGFQLPLSGVLLPLPIFLNWIIPPLISAYWAWSAYLQTIKSTRFFDLVHAVTETSIANSYASTWVLASHLVIGLFLSYLGIRRSDWR